MANIDKAFRVEFGLDIDGEVGVFWLTNDPSQAPGYEAPVGSLGLQKPLSGNGTIWVKYGAADTDWVDISTPKDRFLIIANYNGNAGSGKYLEFFGGQSSDTTPFTLTENSYIRTIIVNCTSSSTGTISVYKLPDLTNPVISISLSSQTFKRQDYSQLFNDNDQLALKVSSGSLTKPGVQILLQTA